MPSPLVSGCRRIFTFVVALTLAACGGGGSGGGSSPPPPPPSPKSISGIVMLGPVANADIEIRGTGGVLATTTTDTQGRFGPVTYSGSYSGPIRVVATGNASSTWICDFVLGCFVNLSMQPVGSSLDFDGALEAVRPSAVNGDFVSVSMLSDYVAARTDVLGALTAANVNAASADIAEMLRTVLSEPLLNLGLALPDDFAAIELFDVQNLPAPGGSDDPVALLLSLFNSALAGLIQPTESVGQAIARLRAQVAANPVLPVSDPGFTAATLESFSLMFLIQALEFQNAIPDMVAAADALLAPFTLDEVGGHAISTYAQLPALTFGIFNLDVFADDAALQTPIVIDLPIGTSDGGSLVAGDYGVEVIPGDGGIWLDATPVIINGVAHARLTFDSAAIGALPNGFYFAFVSVSDNTGRYRRDTISVNLTVSIVGIQVDAGPDEFARERSTVTLNGSTNNPGDVQSISWTQTAGSQATIINGDTFQPDVVLPSVAADEAIELRLDVNFTTGEMRSDFITIFVDAYPNFSELTFADTTLQQCVDDAASAGGLEDAGQLTALTCTGVGDASGLDVFANLASLNLAGNTLTTLDPVLPLDNLQFLDISGNANLPCEQIDALAQRLVEGTDLIVDDLCQASAPLDLGAGGFDIALDLTRNRVYVSLPARNEIAVVSLDEIRIIDRIALAGSPQGIDLSLDGTRLFVAIDGSTTVAVVDLDLRSVSSIELGTSTGDSRTYDVVEAAPDRLFVSANPGSSGFSYIAQVRLDQGNVTTRAANERIIRASPVFARSPDQQFVYVGEGFSPNSLYKLSLLDPDAPIVLEDDHGSVSGTDNLVLNASGTRIALGSGQVLRTGSFIEEGRVTPGPSTAAELSDRLFVAAADGRIEAFEFDTLAPAGTVTTSCSFAPTSRVAAFGGDQSFALLQHDVLCLFAQVSRSTPPDPYAALRLPDLALEDCVVSAAMAQGLTQPEEFTALDCSAAPATILSLEGLDRFVNLETLDLSNSGVFDLSPLSSLSALTSLAVRNASVSDVAVLLTLPSLVTVDVSGNASITCDALDQLVATGVAVQADVCTDTVRIELGGIGHALKFDAVTNRAFVSIPSLNRISEIDLTGGTIAQNFALPGQPRGIDLSADNRTVYAALNGVGDVAVLNTVTGVADVIDISVELDDDRTWDVAVVSQDRIVVSTNPSSNGFGYIVEVRLDAGNAATRVASNFIIRAAPIFAVSSDGAAVYVGEGFSPNSLYKLDATQANLPIVLEDDHGSISGTSSLALNGDGSRIYLGSGQALSTDTFSQVALFPPGRSTVSGDGSKLLIGDEQSDSARVYDIATTAPSGNRPWGCDVQNLLALEEFGSGVLVLGDDLVCFSRTVSYP